MSKKRTPLFSCSFGPTAWQRTDGRALWQVGELCVPGILRAESGVSFCAYVSGPLVQWLSVKLELMHTHLELFHPVALIRGLNYSQERRLW